MPAKPGLHGRAKRMELMAIVLQSAALRLRPNSAREQWRRSLLPNGPRVSQWVRTMKGKLTLIMLCERCGFYRAMYYLSPWRGGESNVVQIVRYNKRKLDDHCSRTSRPAGYGVHSR